MVAGIIARLLKMLNEDVMTDVTFVVQGQPIKCHRLILNSYDSNLKLLVTETDNVDIDDVAPHTFKAILRYLYADYCNVTDATVFDMMHAAKKFAFGDLECKCAEFIKEKLSATNVSFFTSQALHFNAKKSLKVCLDYFRTNTLKSLEAKQFLDVSQEALLILYQNKNQQCSHSKFFSSCADWARAECRRRNLQETRKNFRTVLGEELIKKIQYKKMGLKEFLNCVIPRNILTYEEVGQRVTDVQRSNITVKVTDPDNKTATLTVPAYTSIYDLKGKPIWGCGQKKYPAEKFTLSHKGKTLHDNMTLVDLFTPGESLDLLIDSFDITLHNQLNKFEVACTLKVKDLSVADKVIAGFINTCSNGDRNVKLSSTRFTYDELYGYQNLQEPRTYTPGCITYIELWK